MEVLQERIAALVQLGAVCRELGAARSWPGHAIGLAEDEYDVLDATIRRAHQFNGWSTEENVRFALNAWGDVLTDQSLHAWLRNHPGSGNVDRAVGLILAGNVPLVGLHDVICVFLSGHRSSIKLSSQEPEIIPSLVTALEHFLPGTAKRLAVTTGKLAKVDAVIATGSDNTARYFEHYFGHLPRIIRKSRVSVAVLDGKETDAQLAALGEDVFRYFGLGCRNVSKVLLPRDFDLDRLFGGFFPWKDIVHHNKYGNNYDYTRALWMLDRVPFVENGFLLMKEDEALASPVAALHYQRFDKPRDAEEYLAANAKKIQCVVRREGGVPFGQAQRPGLADYADGVDTLRFLSELA